METEWVQIIVCDQRMPGMTGVEFLKTVRSQWPDTLRIILSGYTDAEDIIAGVNEAGIYQYLMKPWQPEQLLLTLQTAASVHRLQQENQRLSLELRTAEPVLAGASTAKHERARREFALDGLIRTPAQPAQCRLRPGREDRPLRPVGPDQRRVGNRQGDARARHPLPQPARRRAFVIEHCGALPDQLLEAELFGYKRGAFTGAYEDRSGRFQQADGGTIFLDEIGDTSPVFQVKLLRVLQEGEFRPLGAARPQSVDVRVVAATHHDLEAEVRAGTFREDLYYRLATVTLRVPRAARARDGHPAARRPPARCQSEVLGKSGRRFQHRGACLPRRLSLAGQRARTAERDPAHARARRHAAPRRRPAGAAHPAHAGGESAAGRICLN
jgi:two-component system response regulator HupR/HoxA